MGGSGRTRRVPTSRPQVTKNNQKVKVVLVAAAEFEPYSRRRSRGRLGVDGGRPGAALRLDQLPLQGGDGRRRFPADLRTQQQLIRKASFNKV